MRPSTTARALTPVVALISIVSTPLADARPGESAGGTATLADVVVTATRTDVPANELPYSVHVLSAERIRTEQQFRTLPDVVAELPGVLAQKTAYGQGSPHLRGFTGFRTMLLVDGIRLNNSTFRDGPNQYSSTIDAWGARRVEVVRGPASVLYGSDAVGGVVNVLPLRATDAHRTDRTSVSFLTRYGGAESSVGGRFDVYAPTLPVRLRAGGSWKDYGDLRGGRNVGRQSQTGYSEWSADLHAEYDVGPETRWTFGYQRMAQDDAWRTHSTSSGITWHGTTRGSDLVHSFDQFRQLAYLRAESTGLGPWERVVATASLHDQDEVRTRIRAGRQRDVQRVDVRSVGLSVQADVNAAGALWSFGADWQDDAVDSWRDDYAASGTFRGRAIQGPVGDDATYRLADAFVQAQRPLGPRTRAIAGLRATHARADAKSVQDPVTGSRIRIADDWSAVVGSVRLQRDLSARWSAFGGVSQAFRAPNLSDLTRLDTARTNELETPVTSLQPERFLQYEIGMRRNDVRSNIEVVAFHTAIDDLIIRTPTGRVLDGAFEVTKRNSGRGYSAGLEFSGSVDLGLGLTLRGVASKAWGAVDTFPTSAPTLSREPIDRLAPAMGVLELTWNSATGRMWTAIQAAGAMGADRLSPANRADTQRIPPGGTPGFGSVDVRAGLRFPTWRMTVAVENAFDRDYRIHGSGVNEPGRNLVVTFGADF